MLHHLAQPRILLGVFVAIAVLIPLHNLAQAALAKALGDPLAAQRGHLSLRPQRQFSVYGLIPLLLVHFGWGFAEQVPVQDRFPRQRRRAALALAAGPLVYLAGFVAAVAVARSLGSSHWAEPAGAAAISAAGLFIVSLLPIPPLDVGRIILLLGPTTPGWQRARYQLQERNLGIVIALVVLFLPVILPRLPDIVGMLVPPLIRHVPVFTSLG